MVYKIIATAAMTDYNAPCTSYNRIIPAPVSAAPKM